MVNLSDADWTILISRINSGKCTPFLGAGVAYGYIPIGTKVAQDWAMKYDHPLLDKSDLPKVAQFLAIKYGDAMFPKEQLAQLMEMCPTPDFGEKNEPYAVPGVAATAVHKCFALS